MENQCHGSQERFLMSSEEARPIAAAWEDFSLDLMLGGNCSRGGARLASDTN